MSIDPKDQGFLSRWSKRKQAVVDEEPDGRPEAEVPVVAEPESEEAALDVLRERDPELAEQISGIDIDALTYDDDFSVFMNQKVPEFIRRKALSKLWLSSPVLANIDGLNDYDEDFTDASAVVEAIQTAFSKDDKDTEGPVSAAAEGAKDDDAVPAETDAVQPAPEDGEAEDDGEFADENQSDDAQTQRS